MTGGEKVVATAADREAAVGILQLSLSNSQERAMLIAEGKLDGDPLVQAFARHRLSALSDAVDVVRERVDAALLKGMDAKSAPIAWLEGYCAAATISKDTLTDFLALNGRG
jgi:hypothetical protein